MIEYPDNESLEPNCRGMHPLAVNNGFEYPPHARSSCFAAVAQINRWDNAHNDSP